MSFNTTMLALRLVHIVSGVFWVGAAGAIAIFVIPAARQIGADGARVMYEVMYRRRLAVYFTVAAALTILSGLAMYALIGAGSYRAWMSSRMGMTIAVGAVSAILAAAISATVTSRACAWLHVSPGNALSATDPGGAASSDTTIQHRRFALASSASAILLFIAAAAMAAARYV